MTVSIAHGTTFDSRSFVPYSRVSVPSSVLNWTVGAAITPINGAYYIAGDGSPTWTITNQPLGISISAAGLVTGTPTTAANGVFQIICANARGTYQIAFSYTIVSGAALGTWAQRSTDANVIAAYDFSAPPANGGTYLWGSLRAADATHSKVTCEFQGFSADPNYANRTAIDTSVAPGGSSASLRYDVWSALYSPYPNTPGEWGLNWRFGIDDWNFQIAENQDVWIQWRVRMNDVYAYHLWKETSTGNSPGAWDGSYTGFKLNFMSSGPQFPLVGGEQDGWNVAKTSNGYPGAQGATNTYSSLDVAFRGEIEFTSPFAMPFLTATDAYHFPHGYTNHAFYQGFDTRGQNAAYYTDRNEGDETTGTSKPNERINPGGGVGDQYTDFGTPYSGEPSQKNLYATNGYPKETRSFVYAPNQWMTFMIHVRPGTWATSGTNSLGPDYPGYHNSLVELYGMYDPAVVPGATMRLLHRRSGFCIGTTNDGSQGHERIGQFAVTTFMTAKWINDDHPLAQVWFSQIIMSKTRIAAPAIESTGVPTYMQGLADLEVRSLTGAYAPSNGKTTLHDVLPAEWQGGAGQGKTSEGAIFYAWSGGHGDPVGKRMFVRGGGHGDGANNGLFYYDFSGDAAPTGWVLAPNSLSTVANAVDAFFYSDNRPSSVHSYDSARYDPVLNRFYSFRGSRYQLGNSGPNVYYDFPNSRWSSTVSGSEFATFSGLTPYGATAFAKSDGSKLVFIGGNYTESAAFVSSSGGAGTLAVADFHRDSNSTGMVSCQLANDTQWLTLSRDTVGGVDTYFIYTHVVNWSTNTITSTQRTHSSHATYLTVGSCGGSLVYDALLNCVWIFGLTRHFGGNQMSTQILRLDLTTFAITAYALSAPLASNDQNQGSQGSYNRHVLLTYGTQRFVGTCQAYNAPASIFKLPVT